MVLLFNRSRTIILALPVKCNYYGFDFFFFIDHVLPIVSSLDLTEYHSPSTGFSLNIGYDEAAYFTIKEERK